MFNLRNYEKKYLNGMYRQEVIKMLVGHLEELTVCIMLLIGKLSCLRIKINKLDLFLKLITMYYKNYIKKKKCITSFNYL